MKRIVMHAAILGLLTFPHSGYAGNQATDAGDRKKAIAEIEKPGGKVELYAKLQEWPLVPPVARQAAPLPMPLPIPAAPRGVGEVDRKFLVQGQRSGWAPDGKKIVFGRSGNDNGIQIYDVAAKKATSFTAAGKDPAWAGKDGRWIAYVTGSGTAEAIWAAEVPEGKPIRVAAGSMPSWSANGKTLFFQAFDRNQLMSADVLGNGQFSPPRVRSAVPYRYPAVSPDGKRVAYKNGADLVIQQVDDAKLAKRFILPQGIGLLGGWSPDSREFGFGGWNGDDPMPCIILDIETGLARHVASRGLDHARLVAGWHQNHLRSPSRDGHGDTDD